MYVIQKIHKISTVEKNPKSGKQGHSIAQGPAEELKNYMHQQRGREAAGGLKRKKKSCPSSTQWAVCNTKMCVLSFR